MNKQRILLTGLSVFLSLSAWSAGTTLTVQTKKPIATVNPDMYGIFFEDINFAADGGLYAELIKNRSFEFPQTLMGWNIFGKVSVQTDGPFDRNPHYVRLTDAGHAHKRTGLENEGFRGIGFKQDAAYRFSVWARAASGEQRIRVEFIDEQNEVMAREDVVINGGDWKKYSVQVTAKKNVNKGKLRIFLTSAGSLDLEHISLFPVDTWKERENGMRKDLAQALADLNPGVFRFPGGCIVEGTDLETRYDWKKSVGPVENRPLNENRWHYTFPHRFFPDYFQSYGLGFFEYFQLCEDFGAEALPVLNVGLACQYQNDGTECHVPVGEIDTYVQDALDLVEFATGPATSKWGKVRADMGHPEPFSLKYLAIGNEQWGSLYPERLEPFIKAFRAKYPSIQIVGSSGPSASGAHFDYLWPEMKRLKADLVDEHYYMAPDWFFSNADRYDKYDRKGPKVFAGEYASHDHSTRKANNFLAALSEAAFMTGLERNADVVRLATYAPLFAHIDGWQWNPDLIWFDNLRSMRTPNWHVQAMYGHYAGTDVLSALAEGKPLTGQDGLYASAVKDSKSNSLIIKIVNKDPKAKTVTVNLKDFKQATADVKLIRLQSDNLRAQNSLDNPDAVKPEEKELALVGNTFDYVALGQSFSILVIQLTNEKTSAKGKQPGLTEKDSTVTVYTIGDSTVKNGDGSGSNGQWGWGAFLADFLNDDVKVVNHARGGRSSRTYIEEGLWDNVQSRLKPGDYVLLQFGHNDGGPFNTGRARATLKGNGEDSQDFVMVERPNKDTVTIHTYGWYIRQYIKDAKAKGAIPVVVSLIPRNDWKEGKVIRNNESYALWAKQAAAQENAMFIDLHNLVCDKYDAMGQAFVAPYYFGDHTHTSKAGAQVNAYLVSQALKSLPCSLAGSVK